MQVHRNNDRILQTTPDKCKYAIAKTTPLDITFLTKVLYHDRR